MKKINEIYEDLLTKNYRNVITFLAAVLKASR